MHQRSTNYYDDLFVRLGQGGDTVPVAIQRVATAYLDGMPNLGGKRKLTRKDRDSLFWASEAVKECPPDSWRAEAMVLALARYLGQIPVAVDGLAIRVAQEAPDALIRAIRFSGLVLNPGSPKRSEVEQAATK